jgi:hypothetical protein
MKWRRKFITAAYQRRQSGGGCSVRSGNSLWPASAEGWQLEKSNRGADWRPHHNRVAYPAVRCHPDGENLQQPSFGATSRDELQNLYSKIYKKKCKTFNFRWTFCHLCSLFYRPKGWRIHSNIPNLGNKSLIVYFSNKRLKIYI